MNLLPLIKAFIVCFLLMTQSYVVNAEESKTIGNIVESYVSFLNSYEKEIEINHFISQPLNTKKAVEADIAKTETKRSFNIPQELREYYFNEANGTENDLDNYPIYDERLDIFSHQRIVGIYDFFVLYWDSMGVSMETINDLLTEQEMQMVYDNNTQYFVFAADWSENFGEVFVFDKEHNFYQFYFDQDVHILKYIVRMMNKDDSMNVGNSFSEQLDAYLDNEKQELKEEFR